MKKLVLAVVLVLYSNVAFTADEMISDLNAPSGGVATSDKLYVVDDPSGTPVSCSDTILNIVTAYLTGFSISTTELGYLNGVTSALQTQLDAKETADAAIVKSDEAETLSANWINTANPWADNEVADNITASAYEPLLSNEAGLYAALSDVSQFYESGDKVGDADTLDTHDTSYFQAALSNEAGLYSALSDVTNFLQAGDTVDDDDVAFDDGDSNWTATTIGAALEELDAVINSGSPNDATGKVDWSQLVNVPAGFADGADATGALADDSLLEVKLDATNSPTNDYILSFDSGSGGFTWVVDATGAGGDQLVDVVATTPLLVNATTNVDNALPGSDSDITFSMPAATNSANGYMTSTQVTALEAIDTEAELEALLELADLQGDLTDGQLSSNVPLKNANDTITGNWTFSGALTIGTISSEDWVTAAMVANGDWGDFTITSNVAALDADVVDDTHVNWASMTYLGEEGQPTAAALGVASANIDSSGNIEWEDAADLDATGALSTGVVGANELAATAVTAGSYTNTSITVDADGRVTSASTGSGASVSAYESGTEADFYGTILNPQGIYDNDATNHAVTIAVYVPAAFTITAIYISCDADPTTEPTLTFRHKAAGVGYGTPTTIEAVTTTAGVATITSGIDDATIPANTKMFISLSDPDNDLNEISWQIKGDWD